MEAYLEQCWIVQSKQVNIVDCTSHISIRRKGDKRMTTEEKIALLEETLEADEGTLTLETELDEIDEYDSMSKLGIIVMMEDEFGVKLTGENFRAFKTVGDIVDMMKG